MFSGRKSHQPSGYKVLFLEFSINSCVHMKHTNIYIIKFEFFQFSMLETKYLCMLCMNMLLHICSVLYSLTLMSKCEWWNLVYYMKARLLEEFWNIFFQHLFVIWSYPYALTVFEIIFELINNKHQCVVVGFGWWVLCSIIIFICAAYKHPCT